MGCTICGASIKNPNTKSHIASKKHQAALGGGSSPTITTPSRATGRGAFSSDSVNRINDLEKQMRYVIDKLAKIEGRLSSTSSGNLGMNVHSQIKSEILRMTKRGRSILLDDLARKMSKHQWNTVERAILEMVDDEYFDVAEAYSKKKINGRYGRIIRR